MESTTERSIDICHLMYRDIQSCHQSSDYLMESEASEGQLPKSRRLRTCIKRLYNHLDDPEIIGTVVSEFYLVEYEMIFARGSYEFLGGLTDKLNDFMWATILFNVSKDETIFPKEPTETDLRMIAHYLTAYLLDCNYSRKDLVDQLDLVKSLLTLNEGKPLTGLLIRSYAEFVYRCWDAFRDLAIAYEYMSDMAKILSPENSAQNRVRLIELILEFDRAYNGI